MKIEVYRTFVKLTRPKFYRVSKVIINARSDRKREALAVEFENAAKKLRGSSC